MRHAGSRRSHGRGRRDRGGSFLPDAAARTLPSPPVARGAAPPRLAAGVLPPPGRAALLCDAGAGGQWEGLRTLAGGCVFVACSGGRRVAAAAGGRRVAAAAGGKSCLLVGHAIWRGARWLLPPRLVCLPSLSSSTSIPPLPAFVDLVFTLFPPLFPFFRPYSLFHLPSLGARR